MLEYPLLPTLAPGLNEVHWEHPLVLLLHATDKRGDPMRLLDLGLYFTTALIADVLRGVQSIAHGAATKLILEREAHAFVRVV